jgi:glucosylglycerate synthase
VDSQLVPQDLVLVARIAAYIATHSVEMRRMFAAVCDLPAASWGVRIGTQDWPHILADAVETLSRGGFQCVRDHLIALYVGRVLSFWSEIDGMCGAEIDALLDRQAGDTVKAVAERSITFTGRHPPAVFDRGVGPGFTDGW